MFKRIVSTAEKFAAKARSYNVDVPNMASTWVRYTGTPGLPKDPEFLNETKGEAAKASHDSRVPWVNPVSNILSVFSLYSELS